MTIVQKQCLLKFLGHYRGSIDGLWGSQSQEAAEAFCRADALLLTQLLVPMEKWKRDALAEILAQWLELLEGALTSRAGLQAVSAHSRELAQQRTAAEIHEAVSSFFTTVEMPMDLPRIAEIKAVISRMRRLGWR